MSTKSLPTGVAEALPDGLSADDVLAHVELHKCLDGSFGHLHIVRHAGGVLAMSRKSSFDPFEVVALAADEPGSVEGDRWTAEVRLKTEAGEEHRLPLASYEQADMRLALGLDEAPAEAAQASGFARPAMAPLGAPEPAREEPVEAELTFEEDPDEDEAELEWSASPAPVSSPREDRALAMLAPDLAEARKARAEGRSIASSEPDHDPLWTPPRSGPNAAVIAAVVVGAVLSLGVVLFRMDSGPDLNFDIDDIDLSLPDDDYSWPSEGGLDLNSNLEPLHNLEEHSRALELVLEASRAREAGDFDRAIELGAEALRLVEGSSGDDDGDMHGGGLNPAEMAELLTADEEPETEPESESAEAGVALDEGAFADSPEPPKVPHPVDIEETIERAGTAYDECYAKQKKYPEDDPLTVTLKVNLRKSGKVKSAKVVGKLDRKVKRCITSAVKALEFPEFTDKRFKFEHPLELFAP